MLDPARPGNVRHVDQPVNSVFNLNKSTKGRKISDPAMYACADLITLVQRLPRVLLHLLHAETDPTRPWIDAQHFNLNQVTRINYLARMLDALGPAHLGDMDQSFNTALEFNECAVVSNTRDFSVYTRAHRKTLFDAGPRIGQQLLVTKRDSFTLAIKLQHLDLDRIAHVEQLVRILQTPPRHVSHMQQSIDAAEIDKRAVVGEILDLPFDHDVFFDLL